MRYQNQKITKNYKFTGLIRLYFGQKSVKKCTKKRMIAERLIAEISKIPQSKVTSLKSPKKRLFLQLCVLHSSIIYVTFYSSLPVYCYGHQKSLKGQCSSFMSTTIFMCLFSHEAISFFRTRQILKCK